MQQTCLALGAATIGTLFLTLSAKAGRQGVGLAAICGLIVVVSLASIPLSLRLLGSGRRRVTVAVVVEES